LTVTDKQTIRKKLDINHKNTHINTIQIKENIQQKQNYPDSVASYDTQPGKEVGLFYNGPSTTRAVYTANNIARCLQYLQHYYAKPQLTVI